MEQQLQPTLVDSDTIFGRIMELVLDCLDEVGYACERRDWETCKHIYEVLEEVELKLNDLLGCGDDEEV